MTDVHEILYQTLADIPEYINTSKRYLDMYRHHRKIKLETKTAYLYTVIVIALTEVLEYLRERSLCISGFRPQ